MHAMLLGDEPEDFVIARGVLHTVRDLLHEAFSVVGLNYERYTKIIKEHFRPGEIVPLCGDSRKVHQSLNWQPTLSFVQIVTKMVNADIDRIKQNQ